MYMADLRLSANLNINKTGQFWNIPHEKAIPIFVI